MSHGTCCACRPSHWPKLPEEVSVPERIVASVVLCAGIGAFALGLEETPVLWLSLSLIGFALLMVRDARLRHWDEAERQAELAARRWLVEEIQNWVR